MLTREECMELDAKDPLAGYRSDFCLPENLVYLDGNSLGALPKRTADALANTISKEWGEGLIGSWGEAGWYSMPVSLGDRIGRLIGAASGQTVVCDGTSINIYKALRAAMDLNPDRTVIVSEKGSFPTDLYISEGAMSAKEGASRRLLGLDSDNLEDLLDDQVAVVLLSNVDYRSGKLLDMKKITKMVHDVGGLIIWDLCHSAGVVPMELDALDVDFAVGCTYKYLNGGPGAPAYIYVAQRLHDTAVQPLSGWWGHADPFAFKYIFEPTKGIKRFLAGTQCVLGLKAVDVALEFFDRADMAAVRKKSQALGDVFIKLVEQRPELKALKLVSPRDAYQRGSQVSFEFEQGYAVVNAMIEKGVVGDYREPGIMRFGLVPFYLSYADLFDAVECMVECFENEVWSNPAYTQRKEIT
jgi:kynureninase